jgi:hypothetical protein
VSHELCHGHDVDPRAEKVGAEGAPKPVGGGDRLPVVD